MWIDTFRRDVLLKISLEWYKVIFKYTIKFVTDNGSKVTYWGLGYKVIRYTSVSPNEPYKNNIGVKYGSWFMKYELPEKVNISLEDVNTKIIEYFS